MQYKSICGEEISRLAFGAMRLPLNEDGSIDQEQVFSMTDYAMEHGVNYFDTAYCKERKKKAGATSENLSPHTQTYWLH